MKLSKKKAVDNVTKSVAGQKDAPFLIREIDTKSALERLEGNRKLYNELLARFCERYGDVPARLIELFEIQEIEEAKRLIHTYKGLCGTIGASRLQKSAEEVEKLLKEGDGPGFRALVRNFMKEVSFQVGAIALALEGLGDSTERVDDLSPLREILERMLPCVEKRQPTACRSIIAEADGMRFSSKVEEKLIVLKKQLRSYRFKEADAVIHEILILCGQNGESKNG